MEKAATLARSRAAQSGFKGFYEVEEDTATSRRWLSIYGDALGSLDSRKMQNQICGICFKYMDFGRVLERAASKLRSFSQLEWLSFSHNNMHSLLFENKQKVDQKPPKRSKSPPPAPPRVFDHGCEIDNETRWQEHMAIVLYIQINSMVESYISPCAL